jgi:hypothetical protein
MIDVWMSQPSFFLSLSFCSYWFSLLNGQDAICLSLLMSLVRTFSTGWLEGF